MAKVAKKFFEIDFGGLQQSPRIVSTHSHGLAQKAWYQISSNLACKILPDPLKPQQKGEWSCRC